MTQKTARRRDLASSRYPVANATLAAMGFAAVRACTLAFFDWVPAFLAIDRTHHGSPETHHQVGHKSDISIGRTRLWMRWRNPDAYIIATQAPHLSAIRDS